MLVALATISRDTGDAAGMKTYAEKLLTLDDRDPVALELLQ